MEKDSRTSASNAPVTLTRLAEFLEERFPSMSKEQEVFGKVSPDINRNKVEDFRETSSDSLAKSCDQEVNSKSSGTVENSFLIQATANGDQPKEYRTASTKESDDNAVFVTCALPDEDDADSKPSHSRSNNLDASCGRMEEYHKPKEPKCGTNMSVDAAEGTKAELPAPHCLAVKCDGEAVESSAATSKNTDPSPEEATKGSSGERAVINTWVRANLESAMKRNRDAAKLRTQLLSISSAIKRSRLLPFLQVPKSTTRGDTTNERAEISSASSENIQQVQLDAQREIGSHLRVADERAPPVEIENVLQEDTSTPMAHSKEDRATEGGMPASTVSPTSSGPTTAGAKTCETLHDRGVSGPEKEADGASEDSSNARGVMLPGAQEETNEVSGVSKDHNLSSLGQTEDAGDNVGLSAEETSERAPVQSSQPHTSSEEAAGDVRVRQAAVDARTSSPVEEEETDVAAEGLRASPSPRVRPAGRAVVVPEAAQVDEGDEPGEAAEQASMKQAPVGVFLEETQLPKSAATAAAAEEKAFAKDEKPPAKAAVVDTVMSIGRHATEEAATEGTATEGAATEGAATEEVATEDAATEEAATEEAATEEAATEGAATEEAATEDAATEGAATEEVATEDAAIEEAATEEAATERAATEGAATEEAATEEAAADSANVVLGAAAAKIVPSVVMKALDGKTDKEETSDRDQTPVDLGRGGQVIELCEKAPAAMLCGHNVPCGDNVMIENATAPVPKVTPPSGSPDVEPGKSSNQEAAGQKDGHSDDKILHEMLCSPESVLRESPAILADPSRPFGGATGTKPNAEMDSFVPEEPACADECCEQIDGFEYQSTAGGETDLSVPKDHTVASIYSQLEFGSRQVSLQGSSEVDKTDVSPPSAPAEKIEPTEASEEVPSSPAVTAVERSPDKPDTTPFEDTQPVGRACSQRDSVKESTDMVDLLTDKQSSPAEAEEPADQKEDETKAVRCPSQIASAHDESSLISIPGEESSGGICHGSSAFCSQEVRSGEPACISVYASAAETTVSVQAKKEGLDTEAESDTARTGDDSEQTSAPPLLKPACQESRTPHAADAEQTVPGHAAARSPVAPRIHALLRASSRGRGAGSSGGASSPPLPEKAAAGGCGPGLLLEGDRFDFEKLQRPLSPAEMAESELELSSADEMAEARDAGQWNLPSVQETDSSVAAAASPEPSLDEGPKHKDDYASAEKTDQSAGTREPAHPAVATAGQAGPEEQANPVLVTAEDTAEPGQDAGADVDAHAPPSEPAVCPEPSSGPASDGPAGEVGMPLQTAEKPAFSLDQHKSGLLDQLVVQPELACTPVASTKTSPPSAAFCDASETSGPETPEKSDRSPQPLPLPRSAASPPPGSGGSSLGPPPPAGSKRVRFYLDSEKGVSNGVYFPGIGISPASLRRQGRLRSGRRRTLHRELKAAAAVGGEDKNKPASSKGHRFISAIDDLQNELNSDEDEETEIERPQEEYIQYTPKRRRFSTLHASLKKIP